MKTEKTEKEEGTKAACLVVSKSQSGVRTGIAPASGEGEPRITIDAKPLQVDTSRIM